MTLPSIDASAHPVPGSVHDQTYLNLLRFILAEGEEHRDRTGVGTTSVFGYQCRYDLRQGFPLLTTKRMAWKWIIHELVWFLRGRTDVQFLQERKVTIWDEWATPEQTARFGRAPGDLGPVYGHCWRAFGQPYVGPRGMADHVPSLAAGLPPDESPIAYGERGDQIRTLSRDLLENPNSRRLIVSGWDPLTATTVALPPCHTLWQCKVRQDRTGATRGILDLQLYQRSADSFLGVPFNIASYALLLALLAKTHGFTPGVFVHTFGDLHIYTNHVDQVQTQLAREPLPAPQIRISDRLAGAGFQGLLDFDLADVELVGYAHHPAIAAPVAV